MTERGPAAKSGRLRSLDGLRGVAALIVVIHHVLLTTATFAGIQRGEAEGIAATDISWWFDRTPLHLLWDGYAAVVVFFVLSGFVLALPTLEARDWRGYYPQRLVRLYLPVWGSLVLAAATILLVDRDDAAGQTWWVQAHGAADPLSAASLAHDALLLFGTDLVNPPLWSLRWEMLFSLLLPAYVAFALAWRWMWPVKAVGLVGLIGAGAVLGMDWLSYMPVFGLGALLAVHRDELARQLARFSPCVWTMWAIGSLLLSTAAWSPVETPAAGALTAIGAAGLVVLFMGAPRVRAFAESRPLQWLGKRSFSLYLVHAPLVVSGALLLGPDGGAVVSLVILVPVSLVAADLYFRGVERPAHRFARSVGVRARGGEVRTRG